jgi:hypothetical protein
MLTSEFEKFIAGGTTYDFTTLTDGQTIAISRPGIFGFSGSDSLAEPYCLKSSLIRILSVLPSHRTFKPSVSLSMNR